MPPIAKGRLCVYTTGAWEFDRFGQYVTSTGILRTEVTGQQPVAVATAGYASLSGRIGYRVNDRFTIAASATNINHDKLDASPYPEIEREAMLTLTGRF